MEDIGREISHGIIDLYEKVNDDLRGNYTSFVEGTKKIEHNQVGANVFRTILLKVKSYLIFSVRNPMIEATFKRFYRITYHRGHNMFSNYD